MDSFIKNTFLRSRLNSMHIPYVLQSREELFNSYTYYIPNFVGMDYFGNFCYSLVTTLRIYHLDTLLIYLQLTFKKLQPKHYNI